MLGIIRYIYDITVGMFSKYIDSKYVDQRPKYIELKLLIICKMYIYF